MRAITKIKAEGEPADGDSGRCGNYSRSSFIFHRRIISLNDSSRRMSDFSSNLVRPRQITHHLELTLGLGLLQRSRIATAINRQMRFFGSFKNTVICKQQIRNSNLHGKTTGIVLAIQFYCLTRAPFQNFRDSYAVKSAIDKTVRVQNVRGSDYNADNNNITALKLLLHARICKTIGVNRSDTTRYEGS